MDTTVDQFWERLAESRLFNEEEAAALRRQLDAAADEGADARALANTLVQQKRLTPFQATAIYQGQTGLLTIGKYDVLDRVGRGGMGTVFKAQDRLIKRVVAVKVLPRKLMSDETNVKRFRREIRAAAQLEHPHIVSTFDADEAGGVHFLVMEYVDGSDLRSYVKEHGPLSVRDAVTCTIQAAQGLAHAHAKGIIHRDVKPANLLLDVNGNVKVLDMGLARIEPKENRDDSLAGMTLTTTGTVMGTVDYMSPEQAMDAKLVNHRSDIYSLGYVLFYLLTGRKAYRGDTIMQVLMAHQQQPIPSLRAIRPDVPETLEAIYETMVAKDQNERYQSMEDVVAALESIEPQVDDEREDSTLRVTSAEEIAQENFQQFLGGLDSDVTRSIPQFEAGPPPNEVPSVRPRPWNRNHAIVGASLAVLALIGIVLWGTQRRRTDADARERRAPNRSKAASAEVKQYALEFDGPTDYVEIPTLHFEKKHLKAYTVEFLISDHRPDGRQQLFYSQGPGGQAKINHNAPKFEWSGSLFAQGPDRTYYAFNPPGRNHVRHLALVWDGQRSQLFLNGRRSNRSSVWPNEKSKEGITLIGRRKPGTGVIVFQGRIHGLRVSEASLYETDFTPPERFEKEDSTLALYHFDEGSGTTLHDVSGNGHHGTIHGAKWVNADGSPLRDDYALDFEKSYVEVNGLDLDDDGPITIEAWIRPKRVDQHGTKPEHFLELHSSEKNPLRTRFQLSLFQNGNLSWLLNGRTVSRAKMPDGFLGRLVHVAGVFDGYECRVYIDGQLAAKSPVPHSDSEPMTIERFVIGGANTVYGFHGTIDEVRLSSTARYTKNFTPEKRFQPDTDTIALYHFDEGDGTVLEDATGNGHHGTIYGATWVKEVDGEWVVWNADRRAAEWVLSLNGTVVIVEDDANGSRTVDRIADLPATAFKITEVRLRDEKHRIRDVDLAILMQLSDLRRVFIYSAKGIADAGIRHISDCARLTGIELERAPVTDAGVALLKSLPQLSTLRLSGGRITDSGVDSLKDMRELTTLNLGGNPITGTGFAALKSLPIKALTLASTELDDDGLKHIAEIESLTILNLHETNVSDNGLMHLRPHRELKTVALTGTKVTAAGVEQLHKAQPKCTITWDGGTVGPEQ